MLSLLFVGEGLFGDLFVEMDHFRTEFMPFGVSIYQPFAQLGIERHSLHELGIRLAEYATVVDLSLKLEQSWQSLLLEALYQRIDNRNLVS